MGIRRIDFSTCTKCGICERVCPMDVIRNDAETGWPVIQYSADCMSCFLCERDCPEGSIFVTPTREFRAPVAWDELIAFRTVSEEQLQRPERWRKLTVGA